MSSRIPVHALRLARAGASSARAVPRASQIVRPQGLRARGVANGPKQSYTPPPPPPPPSGSEEGPRSSIGRTVASSFAIGLAGALLYNFVRHTFSPDGSNATRLDGAPCLTVVDTHGAPWIPSEAYEKDDPKNPMRVRMATWVKNLQDHIVTTLEAIEASHPPRPTETSPSTTGPPKFKRDAWVRPAGGEGSSCVLHGGRVFEKAGVNISIVHGNLVPAAQRQMRADHSSMEVLDKPRPYIAMGISIVLHAWNPHVPTVHMNYRYFEVEDPDKPGSPAAWWFGGGSDLTPTYLVEEDAKHFHQTLKYGCDKHNEAYWPEYKKWCDKYFFSPHRGECRGVGGIFFDDLTTKSPIHAASRASDGGEDGEKGAAQTAGPTQDEIFDVVKTLSSAFLPAYVPILLRNKDKGFTEQERRWQLLRRGRYVEFNLLHDRGTKFGLAIPGARVESILMSLPETARWEYMTDMGGEGTEEGKLMEVLRKPRDWA